MNEQRKHLKWVREGLKIKSFTDGDDFKSFIVKEINLRTLYVRAREMTPSHNIIEVFSNDSTRSLQFEHYDAITRFFNISAFLLLHTLQKTHIIIKLCCSRILLFNKAQNQIYELARYGAGWRVWSSQWIIS